jgi:hypothetical protein
MLRLALSPDEENTVMERLRRAIGGLRFGLLALAVLVLIYSPRRSCRRATSA